MLPSLLNFSLTMLVKRKVFLNLALAENCYTVFTWVLGNYCLSIMCHSRLEIYLAKSVAPVKNLRQKSLDARSVKEEVRENAVVNFLRKKKGISIFWRVCWSKNIFYDPNSLKTWKFLCVLSQSRTLYEYSLFKYSLLGSYRSLWHKSHS